MKRNGIGSRTDKYENNRSLKRNSEKPEWVKALSRYVSSAFGIRNTINW